MKKPAAAIMETSSASSESKRSIPKTPFFFKPHPHECHSPRGKFDESCNLETAYSFAKTRILLEICFQRFISLHSGPQPRRGEVRIIDRRTLDQNPVSR